MFHCVNCLHYGLTKIKDVIMKPIVENERINIIVYTSHHVKAVIYIMSRLVIIVVAAIIVVTIAAIVALITQIELCGRINWVELEVVAFRRCWIMVAEIAEMVDVYAGVDDVVIMNFIFR